MSIIQRLFGPSGGAEMADPVFGPLIYDQAVWTGRGHSNGLNFDIVVVAGASGPSQQQRAFFQMTLDRLSLLIDAARAFVQLQSHTESLPELSLHTIEVGPDVEVAEHRVAIEFSVNGQEALYRVEFKDLQPLGYKCDDV